MAPQKQRLDENSGACLVLKSIRSPGDFSRSDMHGRSTAMTISAYLSKLTPNPGEPETIQIRLEGARARAGQTQILVHNVSEFGFIFESDDNISAGDRIEFKVPHASAARGEVAWTSGKLVGCEFYTPISQVSLGDGRLRDAVAKSSTSNDSLRRFESFGARVRRLRLAKTMTQGELAKLMSVSVPSVCGWESDRARPRAGRIDKLADILGVGSTELLGLQEAASLPHQIASARQGIATAAGVSVDRVRINIEL